ncbi:Metalloenzyme, LuxS/M16 peptidase-like protein [Phakopsora pachyrhizi]|uniref:Metalloenzyme, LuxS/M16 peptidase-like protein n=1 Tax=Phakopsora pachyrhizi TaxID=170000 RepID=A0AAV0BE83_PHAPC|nr:Metalloenzyme, LuxS/M16 peptidase-like protein [Phakopsora pachyrhizi]
MRTVKRRALDIQPQRSVLRTLPATVDSLLTRPLRSGSSGGERPLSYYDPEFKRLIPLPRRYYLSCDDQTRISTLPNRVRVTTKSTPGHFIGAGVYIDAGSRYKSNRLRGTTHLTDWMAFKSTENQTAKQISLEIEQLGGSFFGSSGRDTVVYQATSYPDALPSVMSVLSDTTLNPLLLQSELLVKQEAAEWEANEINKKPEYIIPELLEEIAYPNNTLRLPMICLSDRIWSITPEIL